MQAIAILSKAGGSFTMVSGVIYIIFKGRTRKAYEASVSKQIKEESELHQQMSMDEIRIKFYERLSSP